MIIYVILYFINNCPENLETMIHLTGHDETYRGRVEEITEAIIDHHDELLIACSSGKKEELTPKYAEQCEEIRNKMKELVSEYISEVSVSN